MMSKLVLGMALGLGSLTILPIVSPNAAVAAAQLSPEQKSKLLAARESVWRAWFANDTKTLEAVLPSDTIAINNDEEKWESRADILKGSADFAAQGGQLLRLEFPRTEIRSYGNVAVLYSQWITETESQGMRTTNSGRSTEIFVFQNGKWVNPGWHLDSGK